MEHYQPQNEGTFSQAVASRRTVYDLENAIPVADAEIEAMIAHTLTHVPSAFNSQSTRIVLLLNDKADTYWEVARQALKAAMDPARDFTRTSERVDMFKQSYGTILFFEDETVLDGLKAKMPKYAEQFVVWSQQANAMHQFAIWTALAERGIGASLQHNNPIVDEAVKAEFDLPDHWTLVAQMPFGSIATPPEEKEKQPAAARMVVKK